MSKLFIPRAPVAIASSFEGVLNNGARECAFVSLNAYRKMALEGTIPNSLFFGRRLSPDEFNNNVLVRNSKVVAAFLALRPLVAVAADYLTVLMLLDRFPQHGRKLAENPLDAQTIEFFSKKFESMVTQTGDARAKFKEEFYAERKFWQQPETYLSWLKLQEPFPGTLEQLRMLNELKAVGSDNRINGFHLYYVTSKDEKSTFELCANYGELNLGEVSDAFIASHKGADWASMLDQLKTCIVRRENIIGLETVPDADKAAQMSKVALQLGVPKWNVWRLQDRVDKEEYEKLADNGFTTQFVVKGGYAFPDDYAKAEALGIKVIERGELAAFLSNYARENGF